MEKILSKSKSRYFFGGKKKSAKDQGISSSDLPVATSERVGNDVFGMPPNRSGPLHATPTGRVHSEPSTVDTGGPRTHHSRNSPRANNTPEHPSHKKHIFDGSPTTIGTYSPDHGPSYQSRYEVHISPTVFSPIMMPPSTPPRDLSGPSVPAVPLQHHEFSPPQPKPAGEHRTEYIRAWDVHAHARSQSAMTPSNPSVSAAPPHHHGLSPSKLKPAGEHKSEYGRVGDVHAHLRSQSAMAPDQVLNSQRRPRRHGIPETFMDTNRVTARETHRWNGQSLGAERYISDALKSASTSSQSSDTLLVQPSASAPVAGNLSNASIPSNLVPLRQSSTVPAMSTHSPLPRSNPSYNLVGLAPTTSSSLPSRQSTETDPRTPSLRPHRQPSREIDRPRRDPPPPPHSTALAEPPDFSPSPHATSSHYHTPNASMSSEKEIGYKGLVFPLPPSSEEGLAMSYSSSQSSIFSESSGRRTGDTPATPKRTRGAGDDRNAKTPKSTDSRSAVAGSGRSSREKSANPSDGRASPTPVMGALRRRREHGGSRASGADTEGERGTIKHVQERVEKDLVNALGVELGENGSIKDKSAVNHTRATSEAASEANSPRPLPHPPRLSEPTKPLSLTPGRKALHAMRSFSTFTERKQLHASASNRDLSSSFKDPKGQGERIGNTTAIPVRVATRSDVPGVVSQPDTQTPIPPRFALPTPPHSSSALSSLAEEQKGPGNVPQRPSLEDVTNALRAQRGRFDELAGYVLDVAQRHAQERDAYAGRVGRLEGDVAKMEREIRGLRWLVLEHARARQSVAGAPPAVDEEATGKEGGDDPERRLRRSLTVPHLATLPAPRPTHARSKRDAIGLGLGFSPDSVLSSLETLSPPQQEQERSRESLSNGGDRTPSMDEIIDKLMGVRQWASADVRVSVVDSIGAGGGGGGDSKRIVFKER